MQDRATRGEADFFQLWDLLWDAKWFIVCVTTLFTAAGIAYALMATEWWRADTVLVRVESKELPSGLAQLGSLASLAGVTLNGGGNDQAPVAVLKSREFAAEFIERNNLLPVLFAEKWDAGAERWKGTDPEEQPDIRDGVEYFDRSVRSISEDKKTGLLTLSIMWKDPAAAADWANALVRQVNEKLRQQALDESERNVAYLRKEMAVTDVAPLQQTIGKVLESELQKMLMARGREQFAFRVVDHATQPKKREKPRRTILAAFSLMSGLGVSVFLVLLRQARRSSKVGVPT
jgi:uncharacterized protein involved in exopolysaccharide biosynthesis